MAKKVRVYELARELGLTNTETLELCESLGIGVKSASSSMEEAHADRARRKADREGLRRDPIVEDEPEDTPAEEAPKQVVSTKKPPPRRRPPSTEGAGPAGPGGAGPDSAAGAPGPDVAPVAPRRPDSEAPAAAAKAAPPEGRPKIPPPPPGPGPRRVISSSGSSAPPRPRPEEPVAEAPAPAPKPAEAPAAAAAASEAPKAEAVDSAKAAGAGAEAKAEAAPPKGPTPNPDRPVRPDPASVPRSASGKPIPPPPGPPRSSSGKPIPPPPGRGGRGPAPTRPGGGPRPGGGGFNRPGGAGAPGGAPRPGGGPPGRGGPGGRGNQRPPRRRRSRRRRRSLEELRPVDVPTYTPDDAPVPSGTVVIERHGTPQDVGPKLNRTAADIVRWLLTNGEMVMATQTMTDDQMHGYAESLGVEIRIVDPGEEREEEMRAMLDVEVLDERDSEARPPVITVMGHVDHGKTKLLDTIRNADVVDREAGGITQHIGAYQVDHGGHLLTFIDTPGHAAFTAIRARGAEATDLVVLVVAADDGVMPQTIEAINHAKAADVPIIVAINKMDREGANPDRVMQQLSEHELVPEEWGGDTQMVRISALQGENIDGLLDAIQLTAEVEELQAPPTGRAAGVVLESNLEVGRGPVATILVQQGQVEVGQPLVAGGTWGRVRALINDRGDRVKVAGPSTPVQVLGLSDVPRAGDEFVIAQDEKTAGKVAETRAHFRRVAGLGRDAASAASGARLEDLFSEIQSANAAKLDVIVRADTHGSLEALVHSLEQLERDEVKIRFLHRAVGAPTENDVQLAQAAGATIIAFNVRPDRGVRTSAEQEGVEIRTYEIIYDVIEDIESAVVGMLEPEFEEVVTGEAEVREVFRIKGVGLVAGCYVQNGVIKRNDKVRFLRDGTVIWHGTLTSLKRFQDDATEVRSGFECGVGLSDFQDLQQGDVIETYEEQEVARV